MNNWTICKIGSGVNDFVNCGGRYQTEKKNRHLGCAGPCRQWFHLKCINIGSLWSSELIKVIQVVNGIMWHDLIKKYWPRNYWKICVWASFKVRGLIQTIQEWSY